MKKFMFFSVMLFLVFGSCQVRAETKEDFDALRAAVEDTGDAYGQSYPHKKHFLSRLDDFERRCENVKNDKAALSGLVDEYQAFKRDVLLANPLVSSQPILFVVRKQYRSDHHNTATMFQTSEINTSSFTGGGAMKMIDLAKGGKVTTLIELSKGIARDPEIHFDGKRIIFSMRKDIADDYHIYEINTDGTGLRQLTFGVGVSDIDPLYMPDGNIIFTSTREPKYCMCNAHIMGNLFKMDSNGGNIHQIGKSTLHEGHSSLLADGRIIYDRWEYVDRNFGDAQGLWTVNPDGTNHAIYWGNNTNSPGGVIDARPIPGTQQMLCIFGSCHDRPWGALTIIDRRQGIDGRAGVVRTWPKAAIDRVGKGNWDAFVSVRPKYEDPYPLSDKYFLCSRMTGRGEQMGLYLVDVFGNETLLHVEAQGCYDPMPIKSSERPGAVPDRRDYANAKGFFYVNDVYQGTHMDGVKRGAVKYLRVVESPEKRFWTIPAWSGQGVHRPAMNWHSFEVKRILGTVPVETDGSAYFEVPSDKFVYFQLLDDKGMMIQSMRSGTMVQSGERTGCVGCHDNRRIAPPPVKGKMPMALMRSPSKLAGWYGKARLFSYMDEVQPVFDKNCVRCHDYGKKAGRKLLLAADRTNTFNTSYNELWRKGYIKAVGAGPSEVQKAYSWGSHASKLTRKIGGKHKDVKLDAESFARIVTWMDINATYYPTYACAYPDNLAGRSPLSNKQIARLTSLTGVPFANLANHNGNKGSQLSFDRPELSPCLKQFKNKGDAKYIEALAIIKAGAATLRFTPRADMAGFVPCETDQQREEKYTRLQEMEMKNRSDIGSAK